MIMKCWCQRGDKGKNWASGGEGLIIAAETQLFPALTENHTSTQTHTKAQRLRQTHAGLAQSLNSNPIEPPQNPKQSGIKASPARVQYECAHANQFQLVRFCV